VVSSLALQLVQSIREAEEKAGNIIREATLKARQIKVAAEKEAGQITEKYRSETAVCIKKMLAQAKEEANEESKPLMAVRQKEILALEKKAAGKIPEAVTLVKERIVKLHADR
jgi:V/A-type H+-transporting ATPase subunit G/H